jgi:hypothetical protein
MHIIIIPEQIVENPNFNPKKSSQLFEVFEPHQM